MNKTKVIIGLGGAILMGVSTTFAYTPTDFDKEKVAHAFSLIPTLDDFQLSGLMGEIISGLTTATPDSSQEYRLSTARDHMNEKIETEGLISTLEDVDGDGILNIDDEDIDGDGLMNIEDDDIDGDTRSNDIDRDIDGDWIPNQDDLSPHGSNDDLEQLSGILDELLADDDVASDNVAADEDEVIDDIIVIHNQIPESTKPELSNNTTESIDEISELDDRLDAIRSRIAHSVPASEVVEPEPVYVEPEPVYVEPEPVYVEPEPVYVEPEPVYVEPEPATDLSDGEISDIESQILAGRNLLQNVQQANDHAQQYNGF